MLWLMLQVAYPPAAAIDVSTLMPRSEAQASIASLQTAIDAKATAATTYTKTQTDSLIAPVAAVAPYARTKWAGANLQTNAAGVRVISIPAGRMSTGLSILGPITRTPGEFNAYATVTGTPVAGYTVTVTFTKRKPTITLPAIVIGAVAATLALNETSTGVVAFDIGFAEPDVVE